MRWLILMVLVLSLSGCGGSDANGSNGSSNSSNISGSFQVSDTLGGGFDSSSERARIGWVYPDIVDVRARGWRLSVAANRLPDEGVVETDDLNRNNTRYTMTIDEAGSSRRVNCLPDDPVQGRFERTAMSETTMSGRFQVTIVLCEDAMGQPTEVDGLPITVSGEFSDLELTRN